MKTIPVSLGEIATSGAPGDVLVCYGLGSCVAVCLYDGIHRVGGMYHCVLPSLNGTRQDARCADIGVPDLARKVVEAGAIKFSLKAKIVGGASVLHVAHTLFDIGNRNIAAVREKLGNLSIDIVAEEVGDHISRTVKFNISDGSVVVSTKGRDEKRI